MLVMPAGEDAQRPDLGFLVQQALSLFHSSGQLPGQAARQKYGLIRR
jgi:hypothetical protein